MGSEIEDSSQGHPASYSADPMTFRKEAPDRSDPQTWDFYYKHCSRNSEQPYYSKTSYDCTGPFY